MANSISSDRPEPTFPDSAPSHPPQPDRSPLPEPRGIPDFDADEVPPSNEPLGIPAGSPPEIG